MIIIQEQKTKNIPGGTSLNVSFPYNPAIVDAIKDCAHPGIYDKKTKTWEVPCTCLARLIEILCKIDDITINLLKTKDKAEEPVTYKLQKYKTRPFSYQEEGIQFGLNHERWLLLDAPGLGKAFTLDTPVLTPTGYKAIKDINIGDVVFDENGCKCNVTNTYDHDMLDMYKVSFSDDTSVICCKDHLWQLNYCANNWDKYAKKYYHATRSECHPLSWLLENNRYKKNTFFIPKCKPIMFDKKNLPLDPYVLGAIIGDGAISKSISFTSADQFIIDKLNDRLPNNYFCNLINNSSIDYRITCAEGIAKHTTRSGNLIKQILSSLNLYGCTSHTKFIPDIYKYSSVEQRLELLQGLMDTDAYATKDNLLQYTTVSKQLAEDVKFLVQSVGGLVNLKEYISSYKDNKNVIHECSNTYSLTIRIDNPAMLVSLPRKAELLKPRKYLPCRKIVNIEYVGKQPGKCLTVDSPNHLYIVKDCIVTHNTLQIIYLAQELKKREKLKHCLIICGINTLKANWAKEIAKHSDLTYRILGQRETKKGDIKIGGIKERLEDLNSNIKEFFIITNIETIRDDKIFKALNKNKNNIDMIVVDECHRAKSVSSQQGKHLLGLKFGKYRIGLTGTILTNSPLDAYAPLRFIQKEQCSYTNFRYYYCTYGGNFNNILVGYKHLGELKDQIESCSLRRTKDLLDLPEKTIINEYVDMDGPQQSFYENIKQGIVDQVDKVEMSTANLLSMAARLRQATACPYILTTENINSAKIERAVDLIEQIVYNNDKVVVFSTFKETLNRLSEQLEQYKPLLCTGDIKDNQISKNIDVFQNDDEHKVMLCTHQKMGTGITLTKASYAIFIDVPWTNADYLQCQDRIHRIGSKKPVFIYHLITTGTIDEHVLEIVEDKEALSDYVVDNKITKKGLKSLKKYIEELK